MMTELNALARISDYVAKNIIKSALEANFQKRMVVEANQNENIIEIEVGHNPIAEIQRLDCIYDDEALGIEKDLVALATKIQPKILWKKLI